ncbi:hypothetical protein BT96DRAFT_923061 [Gymnopus androsaceus JB14]|uniref:G-protein coupled receptors family 1 profile domain-containing protein n=1 Tax=Gymnopus androsaceus JB14 TaxID=1447944 RepID=A0A6A4HBR0_9AGAR|nr:hypothetical protein BT96DRAFT_923061 [Gymnopus androsaceus JB14]
MIIVFLAGFVMTVLNICIEIIEILILVKFGFVLSLPGGLAAQEMAANSQSTEIWGNIVGENCYTLLILMGDGVVVWRVWAIWADNRVIKWTLIIFLLLDIGISLADAIRDSEANINPGTGSLVTLDWVCIVLSLTVNTIATMLIAYRAWTHHKSIQTISLNKKTPVETILLLFVESGAILGVAQICSIIFIILDMHATELSPVDNANSLITILFQYCSALNPVALLILVQTGNTYPQSFHSSEVETPTIQQLPQEFTPAHISG